MTCFGILTWVRLVHGIWKLILIFLLLVRLSFAKVINETRIGLGSSFNVKCLECGKINIVSTSAEHRTGKRGPLTFDMNSRTAFGSLHNGIGPTHAAE